MLTKCQAKLKPRSTTHNKNSKKEGFANGKDEKPPSNKEIGDSLGISSRTVESHRAAIFDKTGARNAVELVRKMHWGS
jgi:hypothetical protein